MLNTFSPKEIAANGVSAADKTNPVIDDFTHGWRDWYMLSPDNPHHWEFSTRKLTDPKWRVKEGQKLMVEAQTEKPNELVIVLTENFFRQYRGEQKEFIAVVKLNGGKDTQTITLEPKDFKASDSETLLSWSNVDLLSFRIGSKSWAGPQPVLRKLWWGAEGN